MSVEVIVQNILNLLVMAIIMEAAIMALFSMSSMHDMGSKRPVEATRDGLIIVVSFILCYKVNILRVFANSGLHLPVLIDIIISALMLTRLTNFVRVFMSRFKKED